MHICTTIDILLCPTNIPQILEIPSTSIKKSITNGVKAFLSNLISENTLDAIYRIVSNIFHFYEVGTKEKLRQFLHRLEKNILENSPVVIPISPFSLKKKTSIYGVENAQNAHLYTQYCVRISPIKKPYKYLKKNSTKTKA